jgi:Mrp family chromosome partitioning ATPase
MQGRQSRNLEGKMMLLLPTLLSPIARAARLAAPSARPDELDHHVLGGLPRLPGRRNARAKALATHLDPRGRVAVAGRALAAALPSAASWCRTILISSLTAGQGKSTVASNLAIALAQMGKRVLLVDASVRAPVQHEIFSLSEGIGLSDLSDRCETWACVIQNSDVPRLDVLPRGSSSSADLQERICQQIEALAQRDYDHVVIDGPAMIDGPLTTRLCEACDVTLMVRQNGRGARDYCGVVAAAPPPSSRRIIQRCGSGRSSNPQAA